MNPFDLPELDWKALPDGIEAGAGHYVGAFPGEVPRGELRVDPGLRVVSGVWPVTAGAPLPFAFQAEGRLATFDGKPCVRLVCAGGGGVPPFAVAVSDAGGWIRRNGETLPLERTGNRFRALAITIDKAPNWQTGNLGSDLENAFADAGFDATVDDHPPLQGAPDGTWSDRELHDAMLDRWAGGTQSPGWKVWLFVCNRARKGNDAVPGLLGKMFDAGRVGGDVQRQGVALFQGSSGFTQYPTLPPTFVAVHEIGHALGLPHCWQRHAAEWPRPAKSDKESRTWMNYPWANRPADSYDGITFDRDELVFLRHAADADVMPGGPWKGGSASAAVDVSDALTLEVAPRSRPHAWLEPVYLNLRVRNVSDHAVAIPADVPGALRVTIDSPVEVPRELSWALAPLRQILGLPPDTVRLHPYTQEARTDESVVLQPGEARDVLVWIWSSPGRRPHFGWPGAWRVRVDLLGAHGGVRASVRTTVLVEPPLSEAALLATPMVLRGSVGRLMHFRGSHRMRRARAWLAAAVRIAGPNTPIARHGLYTLTAPYMEPSKVVLGSRIRIHPGAPEAAVIGMRRLLGIHDGGLDPDLAANDPLLFVEVAGDLLRTSAALGHDTARLSDRLLELQRRGGSDFARLDVETILRTSHTFDPNLETHLDLGDDELSTVPDDHEEGGPEGTPEGMAPAEIDLPRDVLDAIRGLHHGPDRFGGRGGPFRFRPGGGGRGPG